MTFEGFLFARKEVNQMPTKPKRPCRYNGCPNLTDRKSGYCEAHEKPMRQHYEHFSRGYDSQKRYGASWKKTRDRYIKSHPLCEACLGLGKASVATLVHHRKPLSEGGTNEDSNLQSLCVSCHERIHQRIKTFQNFL